MRAAVFLAFLITFAGSPAHAIAAPSWLAPGGITPPLDTPEVLTLETAVDAQGNAIVVWNRVNADYNAAIVEASYRPAGGQFGPVELVSSPMSAGHFAAQPDVGMSDQGVATVVWSEDSGPGGESVVKQATRAPGDAFTTGPNLSSSEPGVSSFSVSLAVNGAGDAVAAWMRTNGTVTVIQAAVRQAGGAFGPGDQISPAATPGQSAEVPEAAISAAGDAAVTWERMVPATAGGAGNVIAVEAVARAAGGSWGAVQILSATTLNRDARYPQIAMTGAGRATVMWHRYNGSHGEVWFAERPGGTAVREPDVRRRGARVPARRRRVVSGARGRRRGHRRGPVDALQRPGLRDAERGRASGSGFGDYRGLSGAGASAFGYNLAGSRSGDALAIWSGLNAVKAAQRPRGGTFGAVRDVETVSPGAGIVLGTPAIDMDAEGNAVAAWTRGTISANPRIVIQSAVFDAAPPTLSSVAAPATATVGSPAAFSAAALDRFSGATLRWDFGDGTTEAGGTVAHVFGAPGVYGATVTATDGVGNTTSATRTVQVAPAPVPDRDGDGYNERLDCDDGNAAIRPGAPEVRGDQVDQNCDGRDAALPHVTSAVSTLWGVDGATILLRKMQVKNPPEGARVQLRCAGKGCPFKSVKASKVKRRRIDVYATLGRAQRRFRAKQTLELRITAPGHIGKVVVYQLKQGKFPEGKLRCLPPGAKKSRKRC